VPHAQGAAWISIRSRPICGGPSKRDVRPRPWVSAPAFLAPAGSCGTQLRQLGSSWHRMTTPAGDQAAAWPSCVLGPATWWFCRKRNNYPLCQIPAGKAPWRAVCGRAFVTAKSAPATWVQTGGRSPTLAEAQGWPARSACPVPTRGCWPAGGCRPALDLRRLALDARPGPVVVAGGRGTNPIEIGLRAGAAWAPVVRGSRGRDTHPAWRLSGLGLQSRRVIIELLRGTQRWPALRGLACGWGAQLQQRPVCSPP